MTNPETPKRPVGRPRKHPLPTLIEAGKTPTPTPTTWVQSDSQLKMLNLHAWQSARVVEWDSGRWCVELLNVAPNGGGFASARVAGVYETPELAIKAMKDMVGA